MEGRFSCLAHSRFWVTLSHVCMYIVLPFSSSFLLPQPKASCPAPGCSQTHQSECPRAAWDWALKFPLGRHRGELPTVIFFSSLFVSILFQLGVDFTLLAGKRRLPSPNFFKSNPFFFYLRNSVKVMRLQILCSSAGPIHGSKSVASLCCSPKHVMLKGAESWPGYLTYIPTNLGFIWLKWPIFVILVRRTPKRCFFSHVTS